MSGNRIITTDTFDQSTCGVCGDCEINQYFSINDNFIDYNGTFYSLREILSSALDFQINHDESTTTTEICLDCKDKVVKFYHFKRKAKEIQKLKLQSSRLRGPKKEKQSKVVHNIVEIVENYTEKCAISSIRIDEGSKKLIIEPQEGGSVFPIITASKSAATIPLESMNITVKQEPESDYGESIIDDPSDLFDFTNDDIVIKEEQAEPAVFTSNSRLSSQDFLPAAHHSASMMHYNYYTQDFNNLQPRRRRNNRKSTTDEESNSNISKAALKMRAYRERLKKPENFHRYLRHQQQQREWNKRHYVKKQIMTGKPIRQRRSRLAPFELVDDDDEDDDDNIQFAVIVDANDKFKVS